MQTAIYHTLAIANCFIPVYQHWLQGPMHVIMPEIDNET